ncbi:MAG: glycosyltransferase [Candidatus Omnitrophota bacterium]
MDLSIVIPTFNEASNIATLLDKIKEIFELSNIDYEIIVIDAGSGDNTFQIAKDKGANVIIQNKPGYGGALHDAFKSAKGKYIITMDADFSHNPYIVKRLFSLRNAAHIVIASRYIRGGLANMPLSRMILSVILNRFLCFGLSLPLRDLSSGFRLYNSEIFKEIDFSETNFNVLVEILIKAYMNGFTVKEIPFHYQPRTKGSSHARVFKFGVDFLRTFFKMWKIRNTTASADYDDRAFNSRIPMQRFWQRQRYKIICGFVGHRKNVLDVGCGTSKILAALPQAVGFDLSFNKLRYNLSLGNNLVNGDIRNICFKDESFDVVICSEVIEHIERDYKFFPELTRILKKNGILILGTPDYSTFSWNIIEWLYKKLIPGGYADEHITRYNRKELVRLVENIDFKLQDYKYILGAELICKFVKAS